MIRHHSLTRSLCVLSMAALALLGASRVDAGGSGKLPGILHQIGVPTGSNAAEGKMSAGLRYMVAAYEAASRDGANSASAKKLYDGSLYFKSFPAWAKSATIQVFLKLTNPTALSELDRLGVQVDSKLENIVAARIPIDKVYAVAALEDVEKLEISGQSMPLLNVSRVEAKVDQVHAGSGGLTQPYKGDGVIVGVLDSGIDFTHPDFNISAGNTRIQGILDYGNAGQTGQPTEWTKAQIDAGTCTELDGEGSHGHGTHVTGIAAGGGRQDSAYIGMAPHADIYFVKGIRDPQSQGGFSDADVLNGVQWIFNKATAANKPCVINLSLGGHFGPHDGSSLYEQALSSMVKPGRIVVAAAGNEGVDFIHTSYTASGTSYSNAPEALWDVPQGTTFSAVDMWYPASATMSVGIGVYVNNQGVLQYLANTTAVAAGGHIDTVQVIVQGQLLGTVTVDASSAPSNNSREVLFAVQGNNISQFIWTVYAFGNGTLDAWAITGGYFNPPVTGLDPLYKFGDNDKSVGTPSTANKVVSVGAYVTKNTWVDVNGNTQQELNPGNPNPVVPALGQLSYFSSHGPTRDGRTKPDLVAPGEVIVSALSSGYTADPANILFGGGMQKQQGTSQATPHITGIIALLLQKNKYLTYDNVVAALKSTATAPAPLPANNANLWGAGKVNALSAMLAIPPAVDCAALAKETGFDCDGNRVLDYQLIAAYPNPFNPSTTIGFRIGKQERVDLAIYDVLGRRVRTMVNDVLPEGLHNVVWDGVDDRGKVVSSGVYYTRLLTTSYSSSSKLLLVK